MKLYTYQIDNDGVDRIGVECAGWRGMLWPLEAFGLKFANMHDLITHITPAQLSRIADAENATEGNALRLNSVRLRSPIPHPEQDIICLGINYADHAVESARFHEQSFLLNRKKATYFSKRAYETIGSGDPIPSYEGLVTELDYEVELGVVIGKRKRGAELYLRLYDRQRRFCAQSADRA